MVIEPHGSDGEVELGRDCPDVEPLQPASVKTATITSAVLGANNVLRSSSGAELFSARAELIRHYALVVKGLVSHGMIICPQWTSPYEPLTALVRTSMLSRIEKQFALSATSTRG
ncbi:hypothetical protein Lesp02_70120 [Lentzea sp. NBRC 105346]|nr:hypothetical protein Lesp02_70120 [Lentzea sp. NBRC 105346]